MLVEFIIALVGFSYAAGSLVRETRENYSPVPPELDWYNVRCERQEELELLFAETDENTKEYEEMVRILGRPFPRSKYTWANPFHPQDMSSVFAWVAEKEGWVYWLSHDGPYTWQTRSEADRKRISDRNKKLARRQHTWLAWYRAMKRRYPDLDRISREWEVWPEFCQTLNWYELKIKEAISYEKRQI